MDARTVLAWIGAAAIAACVAVLIFLPADQAIAPKSVRSLFAKPIEILFVGDMSFDRYIRQVSAQHGEDYPFSCISAFLQTADMVVGNLEGSITAHPSKSLGSEIGSPDNFVFTFPVGTAALLARHNVTAVNLGNNHIGDFGREGMESTRRHLDAAGVGHFGGLSGSEPVYRRDTVSLVSFNQFGGQTAEKVAALIAAEKAEGQTVIVYTHWGEEYTQETSGLESAAQLFVRSGADAVIGSHSHVIGQRTDIDGAPVYYSLGNFIFDQYWNPEVRTGLVVLLRIDGNRIETQEYQVDIGRDGRTCLSQ